MRIRLKIQSLNVCLQKQICTLRVKTLFNEMFSLKERFEVKMQLL